MPRAGLWRRLRQRVAFDPAELLADLVAYLRARLPEAEPVSLPTELAFQPAPAPVALLGRLRPLVPWPAPDTAAGPQLSPGFGRGRAGVETYAFRAPRLPKVVVSRMALLPLADAVVLTAMPPGDRDLPVLYAALRGETAGLSLAVELCSEGPASSCAARLSERSGPELATLRRRHPALAGPPPAWARSLASGQGLWGSLPFDELGLALEAMQVYLKAYLEGLGAAPALDPHRGAAFWARMAEVVGRHEPCARDLQWLFGRSFTARYLGLLLGPPEALDPDARG